MLENTLKRQARANYLRRLKNSARTLDEYQEVVDMYDKLDANRERRERYNEIRQAEYRVGYVGSKQKGYRLTFTETEQPDDFSDDVHEEKTDKVSESNADKTDTPGDAVQDDKKKKQYVKKESRKNPIYDEGAIIPPPLCHPYWRELMRGDFISYIFDNATELWQILGDWQVGKLYRDELTAKQKETLFLRAVRLASTEQIGRYTGKTDRAVRKLLAAALERIRKPLAELIQNRLDDELPVTLEKRRFLEWYEQQKETPRLHGRAVPEGNDQPGKTPDGK